MANLAEGRTDLVNDPNGLSMPHLIAAVITAVIGGGVFTMAGDMAAARGEYRRRFDRLAGLRHRRVLPHDVFLRAQ